MKTSDKCISAIKQFEGFRPRAYGDIGGTQTIGYGETQGIRPGEVVTQAEADMMLRAHVEELEAELGRLVTVPLTQGQYDALIDFMYNLGPVALMRSTLLRKLNDSDYAGAADEFSKWDIAAGKRIPSIEKRRLTERNWFLTS